MDARIHLERPLIRSSQLRGHSEDSSLAGDSAENPRRRDAQRALGGRITEFLKEKADRQAAYERMPPEERDHSAHNRNVARLDYEIKKLCIHLNTLAPIFSLPPELLGAVFYNYATDLKRARNSYPWMHLLHVCHHWREVAFSTPMLWTMIRTIKPEIVNFQLAHAATMPLTVTIPNDLSCDAYHDGILERLLLELPRIRKLRYFMRRGFESLAWENAQADAPMLEDLELEFGENSWYERRPLPGFKDMALPKLGILRFIGDEHVSIETVLSVVRPTLTMLELNRWSTHQMKELVLILATLPGLKVFRCAMYYRKDEEDEHSEAPEPPHVALPHLSELYLYDPSMGAATISLLNKVTIPYDCIIQLELNNTYCPFTPWRVARIVNYVRRHFPSLLSPHTVGFLDIDPFTTLERPGEITWVMGMWADEQDPYNVFSTGRSIGREGTLGGLLHHTRGAGDSTKSLLIKLGRRRCKVLVRPGVP
ncbi:hypothetical protein NM688_g5041 [Phlebia brevispora]|uniref:Uncharacterized protein n=1 Tax=Phlebia brevispora TaxID=194682 RepID=A0ACC1T1B8_9APHY|nr:hypothetical protein NM688_g5041 [Phlebia brevispora]